MEEHAKRGRPTHLTSHTQLHRMMQTTLMGVARQQGTTAAIRIHRQEDRGATQQIQTPHGNTATFHSVMRLAVGIKYHGVCLSYVKTNRRVFNLYANVVIVTLL